MSGNINQGNNSFSHKMWLTVMGHQPWLWDVSQGYGAAMSQNISQGNKSFGHKYWMAMVVWHQSMASVNGVFFQS